MAPLAMLLVLGVAEEMRDDRDALEELLGDGGIQLILNHCIMSEINGSSENSSVDTFRSDPARPTPRLTVVEQSILAETERSKQNLQNLKEEVNRFLHILDQGPASRDKRMSESSSDQSSESNQLSVIYSASERSSSFKTPSYAKDSYPDNQSSTPLTPLTLPLNAQNQSSDPRPFNQHKNTRFDHNLTFLKKYQSVEGVGVAARQLEMQFWQMQAELDSQHARNHTLTQELSQMREKNQFYKEGLFLIRGQWESLIASNESLIQENLLLAGKLDSSLCNESRMNELEKELQYFKYLILTANEKYEEVKQESLNKSKLIRSFVDRQSHKEGTTQRNHRMKEFLSRLKSSKDQELERLVESFMSEGSCQKDTDNSKDNATSKDKDNATTKDKDNATTKDKDKEVSVSSKEKEVTMKKGRRKEEGIEASYRKMLFK